MSTTPTSGVQSPSMSPECTAKAPGGWVCCLPSHGTVTPHVATGVDDVYAIWSDSGAVNYYPHGYFPGMPLAPVRAES